MSGPVSDRDPAPDAGSRLSQLSDAQLLRQLTPLLQRSRRVEADLVAHIGEVDARRLYAREASPSMFAYATQALHLSEGEACARIAVARAARQHPVLLEMLRDGRLHLTGIVKLLPHLTSANRATLLARGVGRPGCDDAAGLLPRSHTLAPPKMVSFMG